MTVAPPRPPQSQDRAAAVRQDGLVPPPLKKRRSPLWARLTVVLGTLLMLGSAAGLVGSKMVIASATGAITTDDLIGDSKKSSAGKGGDPLKGPIDLLLLGVDARKRWAVDDLRADTIIVLHIPASHDQAYLVSIPRDTHMQIPPFARSNYAGGANKANAAFFFGAQNGGGWAGGAQLMAQTIKANTGMSFDGAAIIDFAGFKSVIEALGGVRMCVKQRVKSRHMVWVDGKALFLAEARKTGKPTKPVVHEVGCKNMEGWEALDYSRQRYGLKNGDYDRQDNQRQLIKAMAKKASSSGALTNPLKATQLIKAAGKAFVLDTGGVPVQDFIFGLKGIAANDLVMLRTNKGTFAGNGAGQETITPESMEMFKAVQEDKVGEFIVNHPDVISSEK
ncbi:LytR family transcriptional attenuator [Krasilnikovia cinnamomea]|uniref:LytR family transcriptional attenuator n=1 Tax=Krasilnikovia cinnamomea TaxID=349313 RepID=A0A4Q7ZLB7_9ACTN|nr:LCP family protein [Krasilnikovia cinnamomea]RZU51095.1 LytR family transcriptional attenuator [Krasilnikovia cinnamomea]